MKRRTICLVLCLLCLLSVSARGESYRGDTEWQVIFTETKEMNCNFRSSELAEAISGLQPGDDILFTITVTNRYPEDLSWYMSNKVLYSLEDRSANAATAGGAFTYELIYTAENGTQNVLFSSDTVGGEIFNGDREGLHEATEALEDFFYLDSIRSGGAGVITLEVGLDGETQGNDYQDTLADLAMSFAVELDGETRPFVVQTGDEGKLPLYYVIMAVSGVLFLILAIDGLRYREKERKKGA